MNESLKILIVDDEVIIAELIREILLEHNFVNTKCTHDKNSTMEAIHEFKPDLVFLDIRMENEFDGIEIGKELKILNIPFFYISANSDKSTISNAMVTNPKGYIIKPLKKMEIFAAVQMILINQRKKIIFKDGHSTINLSADSILYVEGSGNYINIITNTKKYTIRFSLEWFLENIADPSFIRVHRSFIVNLTKITKVTSEFVFINENRIQIARGKHKMISNFLNEIS